MAKADTSGGARGEFFRFRDIRAREERGGRMPKSEGRRPKEARNPKSEVTNSNAARGEQ
jgi:hypothetical protein